MTPSVVLAAVCVALAVAALLAPLVRPAGRPLAMRTSGPSGAASMAVGPSRRLVKRVAFGIAVGATAVAVPPAAVVFVGVVAIRRYRAQRWARRRDARAVIDALPDTVDLLLLCASAGWSLPLAHPIVAQRAPPPVGPALASAHAASAAGSPRADALLAGLIPLGDRAAALGHVLVDHLRYGIPLVPGLERLSLELRLDRRRRAEEDARRVPVRLLGPLVTCILPAFALLTVVPLLAASLQSLPR